MRVTKPRPTTSTWPLQLQPFKAAKGKIKRLLHSAT
jgi:hypothetical protein